MSDVRSTAQVPRPASFRHLTDVRIGRRFLVVDDRRRELAVSTTRLATEPPSFPDSNNDRFLQGSLYERWRRRDPRLGRAWTPSKFSCTHEYAQILEIRFDAAAVFMHGRNVLAPVPVFAGLSTGSMWACEFFIRAHSMAQCHAHQSPVIVCDCEDIVRPAKQRRDGSMPLLHHRRRQGCQSRGNISSSDPEDCHDSRSRTVCHTVDKDRASPRVASLARLHTVQWPRVSASRHVLNRKLEVGKQRALVNGSHKTWFSGSGKRWGWRLGGRDGVAAIQRRLVVFVRHRAGTLSCNQHSRPMGLCAVCRWVARCLRNGGPDVREPPASLPSEVSQIEDGAKCTVCCGTAVEFDASGRDC